MATRMRADGPAAIASSAAGACPNVASAISEQTTRYVTTRGWLDATAGGNQSRGRSVYIEKHGAEFLDLSLPFMYILPNIRVLLAKGCTSEGKRVSG